MSHHIYEGLVTLANLGTEFEASAEPIVLKLDPTITKLPSGELKANVSGVLVGSPATGLSLNGGAPINLLPAIKAGETICQFSYDNVTKKISWTSESGTPVVYDLSALAADIFVTGSSYDPATMVLTLTDNSATTPDIVLNLAELKKVATAPSSTIAFTGTGEASDPLKAEITAIPPALLTAATTNTLAVTGPNLVSTVNGVVASVPMSSIVPETTHTNAWTKAGGLKESVNGVASDIPIVAGTIVETLGYNAAGLPVYQPVVAPVTVTDNANGTVTVNAGAGQTQTMIRPIDEQTPSALLTAADKFTVLDNGTLNHRSITLVELRRRLQNEIAVADTLVNAPGGVIPATRTVEGVTTPIDTYVDYDGSHSATIILPAPVHNGQRLVFNHLATLNTTVAVTNSSMTSPLLVTAAMGGAEWIAINGKWHLTTERPAVFPTIVKNTNAALSGGYTVPSQTVVGATTTYTNLVTIAQSTPITIPAPANYPKNEPLYLKTMGAWTGSIVVTPAGGQIDGAATYTFNKASATLKPSITVMHDGFNWYVV